jgi:formylglycine-generating enzyme required for sulfatase activity
MRTKVLAILSWMIVFSVACSPAQGGQPIQPKPTPTLPPSGETILIPAGEFQMGCDPAHNGGWSCRDFELPLHTVYLDAYAIDKYEVTNAQYKTCDDADACRPARPVRPDLERSYYGNPTYDQYPVRYVSWNDASDYCAWAGKRLPTEAEWEKAARGSSDTRAYPWGDESPNCRLTNAEDCVSYPSQVGDYPTGASPYGVMDMAGNVWEWVNDWYQSDYYSVSPPSNPPGPASGTYKVLRGGSFVNPSEIVLAAYRDTDKPNFWGGYTKGFRCVGVAPGQ